MKLLEVIAQPEFFLFLLGAIGVGVFEKIHKLLARCNPRIFGAICVVLLYLLIKLNMQ